RTKPAGDVYRTAQLLNDAAHDVQAEPQALGLPRGDRPFERLEDARLNLGSDTETAVGHLESRVLPVSVARDANGHRPSLSVLDGVAHQIRHDLIEARSIPVANDRRAHVDGQLRPDAPGLDLHLRRHVTNDLAQIESREVELELSRSNASEVEQVVNQPRDPAFFLDHDLEHPRGLGRELHTAAL